MFVLCAAISECNNKQHSPLHVELPLEKWLEIAAAVILTGAIVSCSQKRVFVQQQTIAPITIRTCTRPSGVGRAFRAPQCSGVITQWENEVTEESVEISQEREIRPERFQLFKIMSSPKAVAGGVLLYAGIGIPVLLKSESDLVYLLKSQAPMVIGVIVAILGFVMMTSEMSKLRISRREERFVDVDDKRSIESSNLQLRILKDINSLKNQTSSL